MSELVKKLKMDHAKIAFFFSEILEFGVTSEEGQKRLLDTKATLLAHLKKEDDELYPVLWEKAESNHRLKLKLEAFANDAGNVTSAILAFFEKYAGGQHGDLEFDFNEAYLILIKRILAEENELFPEYEQSEPQRK